MTNNDILKKLRVALQLKDEDIVKILSLVDFRITTTELGAIFRKEDHPNYKECGDQLLRNFLNGLIIHLRGPMEKPQSNVSDPPKKIIKLQGKGKIR
ncbi:MAG TPA: DUF1456 family protein [Prolixibacteraceae bacterium]|nr:DUF1456 family protein [Prolixibacteraceae bacterium]